MDYSPASSDPASFNLSQSYYLGFVGENKPSWHRAEIVDGDFIDERADLDEGAILKANHSKTPAPGKSSDRPRGFEAKLALLGDGKGLEGFNGPLCSAVASHAAKHGAGLDRASLKEKLREAIEAAPKGDDRKASDIERYLSDTYLDGLIDSAVEKFGQGNDDIKRLNEVHAVLPIGGKTKVVTFGE